MREVDAIGDEEREDGVLPGFRFHPTDEELVGFYLRRKVDRKPISIEVIKEVDIYKYDPWDLPKVSSQESKEWYFFCMRGRKYRNSVRPNRVTGSGFWKATGIDRHIYGLGGGSRRRGGAADCIGLKKSLVYYLGSAGKGSKTDWMMHEFRLPGPVGGGDAAEAEMWTICRIFKRNVPHKRYSPPQTWESPPATDSGSKTCSEESDGVWDVVDDYPNPAVPTFWESDFNSAAASYEEKVQPYMWASPAHASPPALQQDPTTHGNDFWDEVRRMMEIPLDSPSVIYGCTH